LRPSASRSRAFSLPNFLLVLFVVLCVCNTVVLGDCTLNWPDCNSIESFFLLWLVSLRLIFICIVGRTISCARKPRQPGLTRQERVVRFKELNTVSLFIGDVVIEFSYVISRGAKGRVPGHAWKRPCRSYQRKPKVREWRSP
jgi:hypothetical protein